MPHAPGYISHHHISFPCLSRFPPLPAFSFFVFTSPDITPQHPLPLLPQPPPYHPSQPMWSEWRLIQSVRPCLKCNELPSSWEASLLTHDQRLSCSPPFLASSSTTHKHCLPSKSPATPPSPPLSPSPCVTGSVIHHVVPKWESLALSELKN